MDMSLTACRRQLRRPAEGDLLFVCWSRPLGGGQKTRLESEEELCGLLDHESHVWDSAGAKCCALADRLAT